MMIARGMLCDFKRDRTERRRIDISRGAASLRENDMLFSPATSSSSSHNHAMAVQEWIHREVEKERI